jgi:reactive intermediate/imine deaminase
MRAFFAVSLVFVTIGCQPAASPSVVREDINLAARTDSLPYSNAVRVGNTLYLAGRLGVDPVSGVPPEDVTEEARLVMDRIKEVLEAAGMTMDDLVTVQVFCPDLSLYEQFNAVYETYFTTARPARAFIGSGPLLRGARFEVQGIAVKTD